MGRGEDYIFNIPLEETGFYLDRWLKMIAGAQLGIFILSNFLRLRGCRIHKAIYGLTLTLWQQDIYFFLEIFLP